MGRGALRRGGEGMEKRRENEEGRLEKGGKDSVYMSTSRMNGSSYDIYE